MKKLAYIVFGFTAIIGLILSFQNIGTSAQVGIFFSTVQQSLFVPMMLMFFLGIMGGICLGYAFTKKERGDDDLGGY